MVSLLIERSLTNYVILCFLRQSVQYLTSYLIQVLPCTLFYFRGRMTKFESNCADGTGNRVACHQVGEYLSVVKNDHVKAGRVFKKNCESLKHAPSCFNLGRLFRKCFFFRTTFRQHAPRESHIFFFRIFPAAEAAISVFFF